MASPPFPVGSLVIVSGLERAEFATMNGLPGLVVGLGQNEQVLVRFPGPSIKQGQPPTYSVRTRNLTLYEGPARQAELLRQRVLSGRAMDRVEMFADEAFVRERSRSHPPWPENIFVPPHLPASRAMCIWLLLLALNGLLMLAVASKEVLTPRWRHPAAGAAKGGEQVEGRDFVFEDAKTRAVYHSAREFTAKLRMLEGEVLELADGLRAADLYGLGFTVVNGHDLDEPVRAAGRLGMKWFPTGSCSPYGSISTKTGVSWHDEVAGERSGVCVCPGSIFLGKPCGTHRVDFVFTCRDVCEATGEHDDAVAARRSDAGGDSAPAFPFPSIAELKASYGGTARPGTDGSDAAGSDDGSSGDADPATGAKRGGDPSAPVPLRAVIVAGVGYWMNRTKYLDAIREFEDVFNSRYGYPYVVFAAPGAEWTRDSALVDAEDGSGELREITESGDDDGSGVRQAQPQVEASYGDPMQDAGFKKGLEALAQVALRGAGAASLVPIPMSAWALLHYRISKNLSRQRLLGHNLDPFRLERFFVMHFQHHQALQAYEYFWRFDPTATYPCRVPFNPFVLMAQHRRNVGFNGVLPVAPPATPLFDVFFKRVMNKAFATSPKDRTLIKAISTDDEGYNLCALDPSMLIGRLEFFKGDQYKAFAALLDNKSWMFTHWPGAAMVTILAALLLPHNDLYYFESIPTNRRFPLDRSTCPATPQSSDEDPDSCLVPLAHLAWLPKAHEG
eukprot:TRINITY_DN32752_c0_g1_i1.p1 TRINITY_DN32752_c0_g1~~TRINITY_DN32752_c0_g1_i1.p1  ORF type:complete len:731 (+),score=176.83 TRINITY_DN32752_c0_g1_i1:82-2274(+)